MELFLAIHAGLFFRRGQPKQIRCIFGHGKCQISRHNRTNCKLCRYNRCLEVGMKPDKVDRFLVKRKEREAQLAASENDQPHQYLQEPNRSPSSEASQQGSPASPNAMEGFKKQKLNIPKKTGIGKPLDRPKKRVENTDNFLQIHFSEQNKFKESFRNIKDNYNEQEEMKLRDELALRIAMQKHQENKKIFEQSEYEKTSDYAHYTHHPPDQMNWRMARQFKPSETVTSSYRSRSLQNDEFSEDIKRNSSQEMCRYIVPRRSCGSYQDYASGAGWWAGSVHGVSHSAEQFSRRKAELERETFEASRRENKTSVIARNYMCTKMDCVQKESTSEIKIEEVKEEIYEPQFVNEPNQGIPMTNDKYDQYVAVAALNSNYIRENLSSVHNKKPFENCSSVLKRKHSTDVKSECLPVHKYQPYMSVIQRNTQTRDQASPRHTLADFKDVEMPKPLSNLLGVFHQRYEREGSYSEASTEVADDDQAIVLVEESREKNESDEELVSETVKTETDSPSSEDRGNSYSPSEGSLFPLKKRQRMLEIPYNTGHAINKNVLPVMSFTFEEEFRVMDYIVRIEQYQNRRFEFLNSTFERYKQLMVAQVAYTQKGRKIPFNKALENKLFNIGLEFTKQTSKDIFEEIGVLDRDVRREVLDCTYPALYVVMWAILEGNTREKTWMDQHMKTLHVTKESHAALKDYIRGLENVRSISLKDQERFTSPWAVEMADEEKFERTVSLVGRLLRDDIQLQALYHMFVMIRPPPRASEKIKLDSGLAEVQIKLSQLIYRYLSTKSDFSYTKGGYSSEDSEGTSRPDVTSSSIMNMSEDVEDINPDEKTRLLISLVDDLHDCVDIMQNRSLLVQTGLDV
eukprot:GFUD01054044.1.p1 GENE.GFUD01054044.1~~GFUD01054044.1.p1  ORF type:complete len:870 (+),score=180.42 GFUD01054044.1:39-2612(+)